MSRRRLETALLCGWSLLAIVLCVGAFVSWYSSDATLGLLIGLGLASSVARYRR